jgi:hypothetical protein
MAKGRVGAGKSLGAAKKSGKKKNWTKGLKLKKGALRATAKRAGALTKQGNIKKNWLKQKAKAPGIVGKRARLAVTFSKMKRNK